MAGRANYQRLVTDCIRKRDGDVVAAVGAAIDSLRREHNVEQLVLLGASTGGEAVVGAATQVDPRVDGVITLSAAGGESHAPDLTGETLFVVSEGDEGRFVSTARELHDAAPELTQPELFSGSAHGQRLFESDHSDELWAAITSLVECVCGDSVSQKSGPNVLLSGRSRGVDTHRHVVVAVDGRL